MITIGKCDARPDARLGAKRNHQSRAKKKKKKLLLWFCYRFNILIIRVRYCNEILAVHESCTGTIGYKHDFATTKIRISAL